MTRPKTDPEDGSGWLPNSLFPYFHSLHICGRSVSFVCLFLLSQGNFWDSGKTGNRIEKMDVKFCHIYRIFRDWMPLGKTPITVSLHICATYNSLVYKSKSKQIKMQTVKRKVYHVVAYHLCTMEFTRKDILGWWQNVASLAQEHPGAGFLSSFPQTSLRPLRLLLLWYLRMISWIFGLCSKMLWHVSFASFTWKETGTGQMPWKDSILDDVDQNGDVDHNQW